MLWEFAVAFLISLTAKAQQKSPEATIKKIIYPADIKKWCALKGIRIKRNRIELWKCVRGNGTDFYSGQINYDTHKEIVCPDWDNAYRQECGAGLHLADSPASAISFVDDKDKKTARLFKVSANINDCVCFPGLPTYPMKLRARACRKVKEYPISDFI